MNQVSMMMTQMCAEQCSFLISQGPDKQKGVNYPIRGAMTDSLQRKEYLHTVSNGPNVWAVTGVSVTPRSKPKVLANGVDRTIESNCIYGNEKRGRDLSADMRYDMLCDRGAN